MYPPGGEVAEKGIPMQEQEQESFDHLAKAKELIDTVDAGVTRAEDARIRIANVLALIAIADQQRQMRMASFMNAAQRR
jgi:hypothetical protein